ncbi:hypothetical protein WDU94_007027 [Cyamophila willieti]
MSNSRTNIDDKLGDPRFIQEMDKLKEHGDKLHKKKKSMSRKIDKMFESNNSEAQKRVSALQTELIPILVEYEETVDKFQNLLTTNANIDNKDATQQSQNGNSTTGLEEDMDVKSETMGDENEASSRMDENLTPFLKDMMDFYLSDFDKCNDQIYCTDILPLDKANLDKYMQELDTEIKKTYDILKEHPIVISSFKKKASEKDAEMRASFDQKLSHETAINQLELFNIAVELKDKLDVSVRNDILHLKQTDDATESVSDINIEICPDRDSDSSDCRDNFSDVLIKTDSPDTSVVRNLCNPMGNTSVDDKKYNMRDEYLEKYDHKEELPMKRDSSDKELTENSEELSENSEITVTHRKIINDNVHRVKETSECEKFNEEFNISEMIEEITRKIMESRKKAEHVLDSKKKSSKICKPIGIQL